MLLKNILYYAEKKRVEPLYLTLLYSFGFLFKIFIAPHGVGRSRMCCLWFCAKTRKKKENFFFSLFTKRKVQTHV